MVPHHHYHYESKVDPVDQAIKTSIEDGLTPMRKKPVPEPKNRTGLVVAILLIVWAVAFVTAMLYYH
jgi:hypothetical protein